MAADEYYDTESDQSLPSQPPPDYQENEGYGEKNYEHEEESDEIDRFLVPPRTPSPRPQWPLFPPPPPTRLQKIREFYHWGRNHKDFKPFIFAVVLLTLHFTWFTTAIVWGLKQDGKYLNAVPPGPLRRARECAIGNVKEDLSFLDSVRPIEADEFLQRRDRLAEALSENGVDGFVLEPGYTSQYYANISQTDWEPWEPEERPFLMLIVPQTSADGKVTAKSAYLAPHFEEGRVRMLGIPSRDKDLDIVIWEEHWNPYTTLLESSLFGGEESPKVMVDEEIRDFIVRGLEGAGFRTTGLSPEAELVRQIKSPAEIEILRAVNTGTVAAVRAMRPCLMPKMTEDQVKAILDQTLLAIGFQLFFNLVLFEEHGALPHGGFVTGNKTLTYNSVVLIDVGAHYLGYSSDITRSFLIDEKPSWDDMPVDNPTDPQRDEKERVWKIVFDAQTAAAKAMKPGNTAASVDIAARSVIEEAGYGPRFTHRLGHGIGIKAHESPYLNKWNTNVALKAGMVFTNEPGIYLQDRFGVRHEDVYLVKEDGEAELLTGERAKGLLEP